MASRAYKRHQEKRFKKRAYNVLKRSMWYGLDVGITEKEIGWRARTRKPCSSACCCNSRKIEGLSMQEKRQPAMYKDC